MRTKEMKGIRWSGALQRCNSAILEFGSPYGVSWVIAAYEINRRGLGFGRALEIGCGEGHSSRQLFEKTNLRLDLIDPNPAMTREARLRLRKYTGRKRIITADAFDFLQKAVEPYDVIYSSFVLHNLERPKRQELLRLCLKRMRRGGLFVLIDCIPPDHGDAVLFKRQNARYRYLAADVRERVIEHVSQDARSPYRMPEWQIITDLYDAGFRKVCVLDRVEREAIIVARA